MSTPGPTPNTPNAPYVDSPSFVPPGTPPEQAGPLDRAGKRPGEIKLISRSMIFYWWPVWAVAFFCAIWTYFEDNRLAVLPSHTRVQAAVKEGEGEGERVRVIDPAAEDAPRPNAFVITPSEKEKNWKYQDHPIGTAVELSRAEGNEPWPTRMSQYPGLGMAFVVTLLMVFFTTNVPLRGLWSFVVFLLIALVIVIISLIPGAWGNIWKTLSSWLVFINLATYLIIGGVVFALWAIAFFVFDPRQFVIFAPGQIRVCEHIGDAVEAYSSVGVQLRKERDDPFRHFLLGFGSSDLVLKFSTGDRREVRIPNVLGLNFSIARVEEMIRTVPS
jgi:hypothetical protein